jgi:hypothetical protein
MTKEKMAKHINGRTTGSELLASEIETMKEHRLTACFASMNAHFKFEGYVHTDWLYSGQSAVLERYGILKSVFDLRPYQKIHCVTGYYCGYEEPYWRFATTFPVAGFTIMDEGKEFCKGFVFSWDDLSWEHK